MTANNTPRLLPQIQPLCPPSSSNSSSAPRLQDSHSIPSDVELPSSDKKRKRSSKKRQEGAEREEGQKVERSTRRRGEAQYKRKVEKPRGPPSWLMAKSSSFHPPLPPQAPHPLQGLPMTNSSTSVSQPNPSYFPVTHSTEYPASSWFPLNTASSQAGPSSLPSYTPRSNIVPAYPQQGTWSHISSMDPPIPFPGYMIPVDSLFATQPDIPIAGHDTPAIPGSYISSGSIDPFTSNYYSSIPATPQQFPPYISNAPPEMTVPLNDNHSIIQPSSSSNVITDFENL